jgi:hypothetical protein
MRCLRGSFERLGHCGPQGGRIMTPQLTTRNLSSIIFPLHVFDRERICTARRLPVNMRVHVFV